MVLVIVVSVATVILWPKPPRPLPVAKIDVPKSDPAPAPSSGWIMGSNGPALTDVFARAVLKLQPAQIEEVNKILQATYQEFLALQSQNTTEQHTDDAGHVVITIMPFPGPTGKLEDRLWSQLDAIFDAQQQSIARLNLKLDPPELRVGVTMSELVGPGFFGWGKDAVRIELWRVGAWFQWRVRTRGREDSSRAPQLPEAYRRFWKEPAKTTPQNSNAELRAAEVLRKMEAKYDSLLSFTGSGKVVSDFNPLAGKMTNSFVTEHTFAMKLARPDFYRIEWTQTVGGFYTNRGAVWNAGDGPRLLLGTNTSQPLNRELALSMATGVSGGAAHRVPNLFFKDKTLAWLNSLTNLARGPDEKIDNEDCYVVSAGDRSGKEIHWIKKRISS